MSFISPRTSAAIGSTRDIPRPKEIDNSVLHKTEDRRGSCACACAGTALGQAYALGHSCVWPQAASRCARLHAAAGGWTILDTVLLSRPGRASRFLGHVVRSLPRGDSPLCRTARQIPRPWTSDHRRFHGRQRGSSPAFRAAIPYELPHRDGQRQNWRTIWRSARIAHRVPARPRWPDHEETHRRYPWRRIRQGNSHALAETVTALSSSRRSCFPQLETLFVPNHTPL